uniref:Uncharacterized protein n=1 Tax=Cacopsylla melanoneura TaxID=428564 RepID=A0A8D8VWX0_9HEMI
MASLSALSEINRSPAQYQCYPAQHCIPRVCHWIEHMVVRMVRRYESGDQWDAGPGQKRPVSRCVRGVRIGTRFLPQYSSSASPRRSLCLLLFPSLSFTSSFRDSTWPHLVN